MASKKPLNRKNRTIFSSLKRIALVAFLCLFGLFGVLLWQAFSFAGDTFGGRNEASLLGNGLSPSSAKNEPPPIIIAQNNNPPPTVPQSFFKDNPVPYVPPTLTPVLAPTTTAIPALPTDIVSRLRRGERVSALILGYGGDGHPGPFLTDTVLQVVYDPPKKRVTLISIPRDLLVFIPTGGNGIWNKANYAFAHIMSNYAPTGLADRYRFNPNNRNSKIDASAILTKDVVEQITGVPVDYWMTVSFNGFRQLIDALGGITLTVEKAFDDREYTINLGNNGGLPYLHFNAGVQRMNGDRAIAYARSRYSLQENGDISRSKRQMNVIMATKAEVFKGNILLKAPSIMSALQNQIRTSLHFNEFVNLANFLNSEEGRNLTGELSFSNRVIDDKFLVSSNNPLFGFFFLPKAGQGDYSAIQAWIKQALET
jgi:LCP family protein required for cell wall assembly